MSLSSLSRLPLVLPALALVLVTACGAAAPLPSNSPAPTRSPAPRTPHDVNVPTTLVGTTWQADIQRSQVSAGLWILKFTNNEILATNPHEGADPFAIGLTDVTADHASFYTDQECQAGDVHPDGTYTYAVVADELVFTLIQDLCRDRSALLTTAAWERQP